MEAQKKLLKTKKNEKRSPLQNLNTLHFHKSNSTKPSIFSSSSSSSAAAASVESRNGSLRFSRSSNSSSDASLPSSSSRTRLDRKPKSLPKVAANVYVKPFRSKENELPKKPISEKFKKKPQLCLDRKENGKPKTNPVCKTAQRSKISSDRGNQLKITKKGSEGLEGRKLKSDGPPIRSFTPNGSLGVRRNAAKNSNSDEPPIRSFTPSGSLGVRRNAAENPNSDSTAANGGSATSAKTPPVEASISPEIQSKNVVSKSAATPVCYGAGHLLSGVTDKRKCRRRGSLRGGCEKINLFNDDEENDKNVVEELQDCLIPLPAEASVRWLLSPCNEGREDQGSDVELDNKLEEYEMNCGNASPTLDLLYDNSDFIGSPIVDDEANVIKDGIFMVSLQENLEFKMGILYKKMGDSLLSDSPKSISNYNSVSLGEGRNMKHSVSENSSAFSLGCLSSGNIVETPILDLSSYECLRRLNVEGEKRNLVPFELDSIAQTLDAEPDSSSQLQETVDSSCFWEPSYTLENLRLSGMRISWRDGVGVRIEENDEFDYLPCLSDEEVAGEREDKHKENDNWRENDVSLGERLNQCAESICTNGGDLAGSCDSDWT